MNTMSKLTMAAAAFLAMAGQTQAATFAGYEVTGNILATTDAEIDYLPGVFPGTITDLDFLLNMEFDGPVWDGFATISDDVTFATVFDGTLLDGMLTTDGDVGDDTLSLLFEGTVGAPFAILTFIGDLDGMGFSDFFTDGVSFGAGTVTVDAAKLSAVPVPASLPLLLVGLGGIAAVSRRKKATA